MPIYEYRCSICGDTIERIELGAAKPKPTCLDCGKEMERVPFSKPSEPQFVGPGFYKNDYKDKP